MAKGLDYSTSHPSIAAIHAEGATFVCRYVSNYAPSDADGKNLLAGEKSALLGAGISIVIVAEENAGRMLGGTPAGVADAQHADMVVKALGMPGIPIYLACDFDATEAQQTLIHAYLDGAASVIGRGRTGIYGGYWPVKRAIDAGKVTWAWQTYAWSGGSWDPRAQLRQIQNGVSIGGADCDRDIAMTTDYGQWPRPGTAPPPGDLTISEGASGAGVTKAQGRLNTWRASPAVAVDGNFGPATTTAVRSFQGIHTMTVDGTVGPATWTELNKTPAVPGQFPAPSWLAVDRTRLTLTWGPVSAIPGATLTGYTITATGQDGHEYARTTSTVSWCVLDGLHPAWTYVIRVWANGGTAAPAGAEMIITMPS